MSDIVDRLRNPKRALWYCREFSRGDDESLDIQEAADEIERLQRVLQKIMVRCADLLDEDQFNELDAMTRAADPTPAPQPKAARFYGFRSEKLAEERAFHADMVFTEREQAEKVNTAPTTEVQK